MPPLASANRWWKWFLSGLVFLLGSSGSSATGGDIVPRPLPEIEPMPAMKTVWIARSIRHNGLPMSIRRFTYRGRAEEVIQFYDRRWKGVGVTVKSHTEDGYRVIGYGTRSHYFSVQVRDGIRHAEGRLVVSEVGRQPKMETRFPVPPGARVLSVVESFDGPRIAETLIVNDALRSESAVSAWYRSRLAGGGWVLTSETNGAPGHASVMDFQRGGELVRVMLADGEAGKGTQLIVNWIKEQ